MKHLLLGLALALVACKTTTFAPPTPPASDEVEAEVWLGFEILEPSPYGDLLEEERSRVRSQLWDVLLSRGVNLEDPATIRLEVDPEKGITDEEFEDKINAYLGQYSLEFLRKGLTRYEIIDGEMTCKRPHYLRQAGGEPLLETIDTSLGAVFALYDVTVVIPMP